MMWLVYLKWGFWILLLWKPIYFAVMYAVKKDSSYLTQISGWFKALSTLLNPLNESY